MAKNNNSRGNKEKKLPKTKQTRGINQELNDEERAIEKTNVDRMRGRNQKHKQGFSRNPSQRRVESKYGNDPSWYALNTTLMHDAGQLSFNNPLGVGLPNIITDTTPYPYYYTPGVMVYYFVPGVGISSDNTSAVNLAARRLYTFVRHANSGSANYDSPDLMLYLLAVDSAFVTYTHLARIYGVANVYSQSNRYLPDALLTAMLIDPDSVRNNLADFRYGLNVRAAKLNSLAVPNTFNIYRRHAWLASNVYKDAPTAKSQLYVTVPMTYGVYTEGPASIPTEPNYIKTTSLESYIGKTQGLMTYQQWFNILDKQLNALLGSEDIGIMAGDILKAYGQDKLLGVPSISEDFVVVPVYLEEMLCQINNITLLDAPSYSFTGWTDLDIKQNPNTGAILYKPTAQLPADSKGIFGPMSIFRSMPLTIRSDSPSPEDIIVATRCMAFVDVTDQDVDISILGTEFFAKAGIISNSSSGLVYATAAGVAPQSAGFLAYYSRLEKFDWHNAVYILADNFDTVDIFQDWDNVTTIDYATLRKLHETALLSLFDVPSMTGY